MSINRIYPFKILLLFIIILFTSCTNDGINTDKVKDSAKEEKEEIEEEEQEEVETDLIENEYITFYSALSNSEYSPISWNKGDIIRYYSAANGKIRKHTVRNDGPTTKFAAKFKEQDSFIIAITGGDSIYENSGKGMMIQGAVKPEQDGTFKDAHLAIAKTYDMNEDSLCFHNAVGMIKFSFDRKDIGRVYFEPYDNTKLHGNGVIKVSFNGVKPALDFIEGGGTTIKVNTGGKGTFFLSTIPMHFIGYKLKCFTNEGDYIGTVINKNSITLSADSIYDLGLLDSKIQEDPVEDLSLNGTANCYIVPSPGKYKFDATVKGVSSIKLDGTPYKADVIWESFGTGSKTNVGDIVRNAKFENGYISFVSENDGNAVIAVKDIDDEILWSWHIWVCRGYNPDAVAQDYYNNAGTLMDRNIGATSVTPGDVRALGLLYQWGRKDPFINSGLISKSSQAESTITWPEPEASTSTTGTISYSIKHPATMITQNYNNHDWLYSNGSSTDDSRWPALDTSKGMYDPCPRGWRVPSGGSSGFWATAFGTGITINKLPWDPNLHGINMGSGNGCDSSRQLGSNKVIWYPATGERSLNSGMISGVGSYGYYWSCTSFNSYYANCIEITNDGCFFSSTYLFKACAYAVRCFRR